MLQSLLSGSGLKEKIIFRNDQKNISSDQFISDVNKLTALIATRAIERWAICCKDIYLFTISLLAVLNNQRTPILLPNYQPGNLARLQEEFEACLTDISILTIGQSIINDRQGKLMLQEEATEGLYIYSFPPSARPPRVYFKKNRESFITFYTSGSTAKPKKINRSLEQVMREVTILESVFGGLLKHTEVYATVSPQHIYGLLFYIFWPLLSGRIINFPNLTCPENIQIIVPIGDG